MAGALTAAIASIFSGSAVTPDPYYEYTTLLLPGSGTNGAQNNTFLDSSTNNFTITRNGNTTQGTFSPFSQTGWGNYFNGSTAYLSLTATSAVQLTNSTAFAIEFWVYPTSIPSVGGSAFVLRAYNMSSPYQGYGIAFGADTSNTNLQFWNGTAWANIGAVSANTWTHVAVTYEGSGTTLRYFINGQQQGSATTVPSSINYTGTPFIIGARNNDLYLNGYLSNLRIVKGSAVYTSNFTPSTTPLTAITNTSLLTCQSNRFLDNSSSPYTITPSGSPSVVAFSPFNPTASWSAATYGGSGYFDGSGDYLSVPDNAAFTLGTSDFTAEIFVYRTATGRQEFFGQSDSGGSSTSINFDIQITAANKLQCLVFSGSTAYALTASAESIPLNAWTHIALVRDGNTCRQYINGNQDGTVSVTGITINNSSSPMGIGRLGDVNANYFTGYLSNARLVVGTCVYPNGTAFTPPTAPLTAITNTSLLLNFTNAGVYDATSKNDLETVGNAQISNTTAKFGSTSIKFDGTGDSLLIPPIPVLEFGGGDFTIEFWFYSNSISTYQTLIDRRSSIIAGGLVIDIYLSALSLNVGDANTSGWEVGIGSSSLSSSTWYHVACTRSGSSWKMFVNGTQQGSTATWSGTPAFETSALRIGSDTSGANSLNGYIQDLRITKGYARYTANFTAPTAAFPTL